VRSAKAARACGKGCQSLPGASSLLPDPPPAGLVSFTLSAGAGAPRNSADVVDALGAQGIWIRRLDQPDCLRACIHITTTDAEIDRLLASLAAL
jgi:L-cysteine/cystine lyase